MIEKKYHYVYKTTNPKDRYYIGAHSTDDLEDGYMGSGLLVKSSIRAHGKENHEFEILEFCPDRQSLFEREAELVPIELLEDPLCMNLRAGGTGGWDHINSDPIKAREIQSMAGRLGAASLKNRLISDPEFRERISIQNRDISIRSYINRKVPHPVSFKGLYHSEESKKKMSESSKGTGLGNKNSQYGTCWVFKEIAKKIKKEELDYHLSEGWIRGRKGNK